MGADAGFDMVPRLSKGRADQRLWNQYLEAVQDHYKDDEKMEIKANYIGFRVGEYPQLPFAGHKFLRCSSKVTGSRGSEAEVYIRVLKDIARAHFGSRIVFWHEFAEQYGHYNWGEVNDSLESYEKPDKPLESETGASTAPIFKVTELPGKGRAFVATRDIPRGTRIVCEKPLFTADNPILTPGKGLIMVEKMLAAKLRKLSKEAQRLFLSFHNSHPGSYPFTHTFKTNALPCGPGSLVGAVYPSICFINHDCNANAHNNWDEDAEHETIHATRDILAHEEITIPYGPQDAFLPRGASLKESFGFDCTCTTCSQPASEIKASDARRVKIQQLDEAIGDPIAMMQTPRESLRKCSEILQLLEEEYEGSAAILTARHYYDAFQVCVAHSDQARASVFAERAYQARVICEGADSPEAKRMQALARKPENHPTFGACTTKWKTTKKMIPQGLGLVEFERWLFRLE